jgi:hypothetical protein
MSAQAHPGPLRRRGSRLVWVVDFIIRGLKYTESITQSLKVIVLSCFPDTNFSLLSDRSSLTSRKRRELNSKPNGARN